MLSREIYFGGEFILVMIVICVCVYLFHGYRFWIVLLYLYPNPILPIDIQSFLQKLSKFAQASSIFFNATTHANGAKP